MRLLLACPELCNSLLRKEVLDREPDIEVIGEAFDPVETLLKVKAVRPEIVVLDLPPSGKDPGLCSHLLSEYPDLKVVAISAQANQAVIFEHGIFRRELRNLTPPDIPNALRQPALIDDSDD